MNAPVIIGRATLFLGDCRDVLPHIAPIDAIVSDPPYGQRYKAPAPMLGAANKRGLRGGWKRMGSRPTQSRVAGDDEAFDPSIMLASAPVVLIWGAHRFAHCLPEGSWLVWDKRVDMPSLDQGDGEAAWINRTGPMRIIRHRWHGLIVEPNTEESQRQPGTSAQVPRIHPTQKPIRVMRRSIENLKLDKPSLICDPFMGSGTTGIAAVQKSMLTTLLPPASGSRTRNGRVICLSERPHD
jgi:site-specific DNA-methyltransferase (adenine-specific)